MGVKKLSRAENLDVEGKLLPQVAGSHIPLPTSGCGCTHTLALALAPALAETAFFLARHTHT